MKRIDLIKSAALVLVLLVIFAITYFTQKKHVPTRPKGPEVFVLPTTPLNNFEVPTPPTEVPSIKSKALTRDFVEVTDSCGPYYNITACVRVRTGPGLSYPQVMQLRNGQVLRVSDTVEADGHTWYKIVFDDWLRYPERVSGNWYVAGDYVRHFTDSSTQEIPQDTPIPTTKRILVDRSDQMLYAYDGDTLFMKESISTGLDGTPTPRGTFYIYKKTPSRYMQGPLPGISDQYYDLPGVPWNLYFTEGGAVIHGAYWHDHFGRQWSHGCVNLPPDKAQKIYQWAELGMPVTIRD